MGGGRREKGQRVEPTLSARRVAQRGNNRASGRSSTRAPPHPATAAAASVLSRATVSCGSRVPRIRF